MAKIFLDGIAASIAELIFATYLLNVLIPEHAGASQDRKLKFQPVLVNPHGLSLFAIMNLSLIANMYLRQHRSQVTSGTALGDMTFAFEEINNHIVFSAIIITLA